MPTTNTNKHWAMQRKLLMNTRTGFNAEVYRHFKDVVDNDATTSASRKELRDSLLINNKDSRTTATFKIQYFREQVQKVHLKPEIYGIPVTTFHESVKFHPQVRLYFSEDLHLVEEGYSPIEAEVTFRLMRESSATLTPTEAKNIANKIKTLFCTGNGFTWKKGREKWVYKDEAKGYDFRLLAWNETEAKKVIEQVLDIHSHSPDWDYLSVATKKKTFATVPGNHTVYGKSRRKPRDRPIGYVRFRYAELKIWGMNDITLVDRTGFRRSPLVAA